jgi:hypothetical protein
MKALTGGWSAKLSYFCYLKFSPLHSRWPSTLLFLILSLWFPSCINWPLQCQWEDCMYNVGRLIIIMKNLQFHLQNINLNFLGSSSNSTQEWSWQSGFQFDFGFQYGFCFENLIHFRSDSYYYWNRQSSSGLSMILVCVMVSILKINSNPNWFLLTWTWTAGSNLQSFSSLLFQ